MGGFLIISSLSAMAYSNRIGVVCLGGLAKSKFSLSLEFQIYSLDPNSLVQPTLYEFSAQEKRKYLRIYYPTSKAKTKIH